MAGLLYLTFVLDIIHSLCGVGGDIFFTVAMLFVGKRGNSAKVFSVISWSRIAVGLTFASFLSVITFYAC